jgi:hypothetical protein
VARRNPAARLTVRLADIRIMRGWEYVVFVAQIVSRRREKRALAELQTTMTDLATLVGERWREADARDAELLRLTRRLAQLTVAVVVLTVVVIGVTVWVGASA